MQVTLHIPGPHRNRVHLICLGFWEKHECHSHRAPVAQAAQHSFSPLFHQPLPTFSQARGTILQMKGSEDVFCPILQWKFQKKKKKRECLKIMSLPYTPWCFFLNKIHVDNFVISHFWDHTFAFSVYSSIFWVRIKSQPNQKMLLYTWWHILPQGASVAVLIFACRSLLRLQHHCPLQGEVCLR